MAMQRDTDRVVQDRYALHGVLGRGGMGVVWSGEDTLLQRPVAVKEIVLPSHMDDDERGDLRERALREARAAARLSHPNAVSVLDMVEENERLFIVMELVQAPNLTQVVRGDGPLPVDRAATIGLDVLSALEAAHAHGITHRDVKPSNIMLTANGTAKLADFGIASISDDPRITSTGLVVGSPPFMSPEQAMSNVAGPPSDLWSLGSTLYFAVEGVPPFDKGHSLSTLSAIVHEHPRAPLRAGPLEPILLALLAKDPASRPPAMKLRRMLEDVRDRCGPLPPPMVVHQPTAPVPLAVVEPVGAADEWRTDLTTDPAMAGYAAPRRWPAVLAGAVVIALLAAVGIWAFSRTGTSRDTGAAASRGASTVATTTAVLPSNAPASTAPSPSTTAPPGTTAPGTPAPPPTAAPAPAGVPRDWVAYTDPATGYTISHPPAWTISRNGSATDFRDPATNTYLRIDWQQPPGPSAQGAWEAYEPRFASEVSNYRRIQMTPTTYQGYEASNWEYTYTAGSATLHAADLGFIVPKRYGFALNFQTRDQSWESSQPLFDAFKASFRAPR